MNENLTQKDWLLISAYLDGRFSDAEKTAFDSRLNSDSVLNSAFCEIRYTRSLLKALPHKRAPRNFTLSAQYEKKASRKWGLNRFFGLASAASAVALVAVFAFSSNLFFSAKTAAPAPMMAALPEAAMDAAAADEATSNAPMIITWNQQPGRGGGGGSDAVSLATGMGGYGGGAPDVSMESMVTAVPTEIPQASAKMAVTPDPSTLILGLPESGTEGEIIAPYSVEASARRNPLSASTIWMISLGALTLLFAVLAVILRKR